MSDVRMKFFGNGADAERAIVSLEKKYDDLLNKVDQLAKRSKKAADESKTGFDDAAESVSDYVMNLVKGATVLGTFGAALASLKKDYDQLVEAQRKAAQGQITYAAAAREALINMSGQNPAAFHKRVGEISAATGVSPTNVVNALSNASSAQGNLADERTFDTTQKVLRFIPDVVEAQPAMSVAAMDIQRLEQNADAEDAIGFMNAVGKRVHVASQKDIGENVAPAIIDMAREGTGFRESAAIVAAITQGMNDPTGKRSRTATTALDTQLRAAFPDIDGGTDAIIRHLQQNPAERDKFLKTASFELAAGGTMKAILTQGSAVALDMDSALKEIPELTESERFYQSGLSRLESDPLLFNASVDRGIKAASERGHLANLQGGGAAINREGIGEFLSNNGIGAIERSLFLRSYDADVARGRDPLESALGVYESAKTEREMGGGMTAWMINMWDGERAKRENKAFDDMISTLKAIQNNTATQRNRNANGE